MHYVSLVQSDDEIERKIGVSQNSRLDFSIRDYLILLEYGRSVAKC